MEMALIPRRAWTTISLLVIASALLAGNAHSEPNLVARIDGNVVADNSTISLNGTPFGGIEEFIVVLRNEGNPDLVFDSSEPVVLSTTTPAAFAVIQPALETGDKLSPNGSTAWKLTFTPSQPGAYEAITTIGTNAADPEFKLTFSGSVVAAEMVVRINGQVVEDNAAVNLGYEGVGGLAQTVITLRNESPVDLLFEGSPAVALTAEPPDGAVVVQPALEAGNKLSPNGSTAYAVQLTPQQPGLVTATTSIETNEPDSPFELRFAGMGIGVNGESDLCGTLQSLQDDWQAFLQEYGVATDDLNSDGLPDSLSLALLHFGGCQGSTDMQSAARAAYEHNLLSSALEPDPDSEELASFRRGLAAAMATSAGLQAAVIDEIEQTGLLLDNQYLNVTCTSGVCSPERADFKYMEGLATKAIDEPFAGDGDFDEDGSTNAQEWQNIQAGGGDEEDFIAAATDPSTDGSPAPPRAVGCSGVKHGEQSTAAMPWELFLCGVILAAAGLVKRPKRIHARAWVASDVKKRRP